MKRFNIQPSLICGPAIMETIFGKTRGCGRPNRFEDLLPNSTDPNKSRLRGKLLTLLNSQGEIVPAASSPLGKLWRLVNAQNSSLEECEEVVQLDAAMASRIFRVANSAAYAAKATNISEAVRYIGFKRVRELGLQRRRAEPIRRLPGAGGVECLLAAQHFRRAPERAHRQQLLSDGRLRVSGRADSRCRLALSQHPLPRRIRADHVLRETDRRGGEGGPAFWPRQHRGRARRAVHAAAQGH